MKRSDKYRNTDTFKFVNVNPKNRITGDCVFRAFTLAMDQDYNQTVMEMAELMCKTGYAMDDTKGEEKYLALKGWTKLPQPRHSDGTKYTGREFCKVIQKHLADSRVKVYAGISISPNIIAHIGGNHTVAIMDGYVCDIWDSTDGCIGNYWIKKEC